MRPFRFFIMRLHAGLRKTEHGREVGRDHRIPVVLLHAQQQVVARDGGVVHQDGRQPFGAFELRKQCIDGLGLARIEHGAAPWMPFALNASVSAAAPSAEVDGADDFRAARRRAPARSRDRCRARRR